MASKLGQLLLWGNLITPDQLEHALDEQRSQGGRIGEILNRLGYITDDDVTRTLGMKYGVPTATLAQLEVDSAVLGLVPRALVRSRRVIPLARADSTLTCAIEDPTRIDVVRELEFNTGLNIQLALVTPAVMTEALDRLYPEKTSAPVAATRAVTSQRAAIAVVVEALEQLSPEKLEYVRRFVAAIR